MKRARSTEPLHLIQRILYCYINRKDNRIIHIICKDPLRKELPVFWDAPGQIMSEKHKRVYRTQTLFVDCIENTIAFWINNIDQFNRVICSVTWLKQKEKLELFFYVFEQMWLIFKKDNDNYVIITAIYKIIQYIYTDLHSHAGCIWLANCFNKQPETADRALSYLFVDESVIQTTLLYVKPTILSSLFEYIQSIDFIAWNSKYIGRIKYINYLGHINPKSPYSQMVPKALVTLLLAQQTPGNIWYGFPVDVIRTHIRHYLYCAPITL